MVTYPSRPAPVDFSGFEGGLDALREGLEERRTRKVLDDYVTSLYGQGGEQEMSLASLAPQGAPVGQVTRAPLSAPAAGDDIASQRVAQAHGDMGGDVFKRFMSTVQAGGLTNPAALAAVASTGKNESGFSAKNAAGTWSDPSQSGEPGTSGGILSWRGERLSNLQKFAAQNGGNGNAPTPEQQAQFFLQENPQLIAQLQKARTPQEAQQMMNNAWRFAGYDQPGGEAGERIADAQALFGQFGGQQPSQDARAALPGSQGVQMAQSVPAASGGSLLPPAEVMRGLLRNKGTREFGVLLAREAQKARQGDPEAALRLQKLQLEVEQMRNPDSSDTEYGLNPIWGVDPETNEPVLGTMGKNGTFKRVDTGGVRLEAGVDRVDLGTQWGLLNKRTGQIEGYMPKDIAGAQEQEEIGTASGKARAAALGDMQAAQNALELIDSLRNDPNRERGTGFSATFNAIPGTRGYDFQTKVEQAKSGAFLSAIQQLRGMGALSNAEGQTATAAVTRLNTATSEDEFMKALDDYEKIVRQGYEKAASRVGQISESSANTNYKQKYGLD